MSLPLLVLGCSLSGPTSVVRGPSSSARSESPASSARISGSPLPAAVTVVTPLGLNLRKTADPTGDRVSTLSRGQRLDVLESKVVRAQPWLRVRTHDSDALEGWVLNGPDLLIDRPMATQYDPSGFSLLYPEDWTVNPAGPTTTLLKAPTGQESLSLQYEDDPAKLMAVPTSPGRPVREEGPVEVYGKTVFITVYRLNASGYQFEVRFRWSETRAFLFLGTGPANDTKLFRQLLASVIISA